MRPRIAREPLIAPSLVRLRTVTGALMINALRGSVMFAVLYFCTLHLQHVLDRSAMITGLAYLPFTVAAVLASAASPRLVRRFGARWVIIGGAGIAVVGALLFTRITPYGTLLLDVIMPTVVVGLGLALIIVPVTTAGMSQVPTGQTGAVSGLLNVSLQLGGAIGLAALSAAANLAGADRIDAGGSTEEALTHGFRIAFLFAAVLLAVVALIALLSFRAEGRGQDVGLTDLMT